MNILQRLWHCFGCNYHCEEATDPERSNLHPGDAGYPKINFLCCPRRYPLSIYLRNLAGVWNNNHRDGGLE